MFKTEFFYKIGRKCTGGLFLYKVIHRRAAGMGHKFSSIAQMSVKTVWIYLPIIV